MRIAYVCADPGLPVFGRKGGSVHVQEVVRALVRRGDEVHLFATRWGGEAPGDLAPVVVHALPEVGRGPAAEREARARAADAGLAEALAAAGPFDLVYERYSLWSRAGMAEARRAGVPGVLEVNAPLVEEQARHRVLVDRAGAEAVARGVLADATVVAAVSEEVAAWARQWSPAPSRVHVVANGVDPERIRPAPRAPDPETFTVGFVGTLKPWHGLDTLVDAMALLAGDPGWRLLVVGDGPEAPALARTVEQRGLAASTELTGAVDPAAVPGHLARMDVAVAPYPALDGFYFSPLKLYEYLAAGLPVVASSVGQVAEVLDHGRTGVLCPPGDPAALAAALAGLRADPRRCQALGRAGRAEVVRRHSWCQVVERVLALAGAGSDAGADHAVGAVA
ncbi:MAG: glycosyltransferase family 4 protein [Actinobacteria bacterium]|nr:glycosyltransferase family 4 protein [Actinomycetota bacterium]